jgi:putative transposase
VIRDNRDGFDLTLMCDLFEVGRQGYYDWLDRPAPASAAKREALDQAIRQSHVESHCRYGSPKIHGDLVARGVACCVNTVAKRMKALKLASVVHKRFRVTTTDSNHDHPVFENRLDRDFVAAAPNQKWAADITYIPTGEGFVYLAGVVDLFSRKVVGWSMKSTLHADLCVEALEMALAARRPPTGDCYTTATGAANTRANNTRKSWPTSICPVV